MPPDRTRPIWLEDPIFVVGSPRSGTTLVQCIISASEHAYSLPETHFFSMVLPAMGCNWNETISVEQAAQAAEVLAQEAEMELPQPAELLAEAEHIAQSSPRAIDLFLAVVERYRPSGDLEGHLRLVEKTPLHVLHLEQIVAAFPSAKVVNVVRDPLDVVSSWLASPFAVSRSVVAYAQEWTGAVLAAERFGQAHPGRLHTVTLEGLVRSPELTVRALANFLGVSYDGRMLTEFGQQAERTIGKQETWKADVQTGVLMNREGIWRGRISPGQAWLVARATQAVRMRYGYINVPDWQPVSSLQALAGEAVVRFREGRQVSNLPSSLRHAATPLKYLARQGAPASARV